MDRHHLPPEYGQYPNGLRTGPDSNIWFTDTGATKAIGRFDVGAPTALISPPVVARVWATGHPADVRDGARWADWAGQQPSLNAFGFDGYQWRIDGSAVAGPDRPVLHAGRR